MHYLSTSSSAATTPEPSQPSTDISPLSLLPTEIIIHIFDLAASSSKPTGASLALTCRTVYQWIIPILYRTVVLTTKIQNDLFERTLRSKDPEFFERYLRYYAPAAGHGHFSDLASPIVDSFSKSSSTHLIGNGDATMANGVKGYATGAKNHEHGHGHGVAPGWHAIKGVRALMMSTSCRPTDDKTGHARPHEVAIKGFVRPSFFAYPAFESVTRLFICDVPLIHT